MCVRVSVCVGTCACVYAQHWACSAQSRIKFLHKFSQDGRLFFNVRVFLPHPPDRAKLFKPCLCGVEYTPLVQYLPWSVSLTCYFGDVVFFNREFKFDVFFTT